jgi:hypothetical protein
VPFEPFLWSGEWALCTVCRVPVKVIDQGRHDRNVHPPVQVPVQTEQPPAPGEDDPGRGLAIVA